MTILAGLALGVLLSIGFSLLTVASDNDVDNHNNSN